MKKQIVWIMTDTTRYDMVGCYGNPDMKTPCIDALAAKACALSVLILPSLFAALRVRCCSQAFIRMKTAAGATACPWALTSKPSASV